MLPYVLAAVVLMGASAAAAPLDDAIETQGGAIAVHAFHHASLSLKWNGKLVLVDPAPGVGSPAGEDPVKPFAGLTPDVILVTHGHFDHFDVAVLQAVGGKAEIVAPKAVFDAMPPGLKVRTKVLNNGQSATAAGIPILAVAAYNTTPTRQQFHPKGVGNGYVLDLGGKRIYIAGDTEETPEIAHLAHIDAAFLPMNLPYTQTVAAAAKWVHDFKPGIVYPYHYLGTDGSAADLDAFVKLVGRDATVKLLKWY